MQIALISRSMRWLRGAAVAAVGLGAMPVLAAGMPEALTLPAAETMALEHNPGLAAQHAQAEAMAEIPPQVGSLPDPVISLNAMNLPVDSFSLSQENMTQLQLGVAQAIPFPGKLELKRQAAAFVAEAVRHDEREFRLMLLRNVRIRWWNLVWLDKALAIVRHNQALLRGLVRIAETKYATGQGLQQDVLLAQLELSNLAEQELKLQAQRVREATALNALLGRPAGAPVRLPPMRAHRLARISKDIPALKQWARMQRPLLLAMDHRTQAAERMVALAEKEHYPDFKIGAAYGLRSGLNPATGRSRTDFASIMLSMTVPLYASTKQDRLVDQRKAEKAKADFSLQDMVNQVDAEIEAAATDFRLAREQVVLFDQGILPQARQTTASMLAGYQTGKVDFLNLVRAQLTEFNTEIRYWREIARAHQAKARLLAAIGIESEEEFKNKEGIIQ